MSGCATRKGLLGLRELEKCEFLLVILCPTREWCLAGSTSSRVQFRLILTGVSGDLSMGQCGLGLSTSWPVLSGRSQANCTLTLAIQTSFYKVWLPQKMWKTVKWSQMRA